MKIYSYVKIILFIIGVLYFKHIEDRFQIINMVLSRQIDIIEEQSYQITMLKQRLTDVKTEISIIKDEINVKDVKYLTITAYTPSPEETDTSPYITAINTKVRPGIVAVSPDLFEHGWSFGKKVYIEDIGVLTIEDRMGDSRVESLDIFMYDKDDAIKFGKKKKLSILLYNQI